MKTHVDQVSLSTYENEDIHTYRAGSFIATATAPNKRGCQFKTQLSSDENKCEVGKHFLLRGLAGLGGGAEFLNVTGLQSIIVTLSLHVPSALKKKLEDLLQRKESQYKQNIATDGIC